MLHAQGFVSRRREGLFVYYALADESVSHTVRTLPAARWRSVPGGGAKTRRVRR
jgi:hypothetical protein